jgi:hypothetical protein
VVAATQAHDGGRRYPEADQGPDGQLVALGKAHAAGTERGSPTRQALAGHDDQGGKARMKEIRDLEHAVGYRAGHDDDGVRAWRQRVGDHEETTGEQHDGAGGDCEREE